MTRLELVRRLAEFATRPVADLGADRRTDAETVGDHGELFVWFEDTSARRRDGRRGIAGLPESLLPCARGMRVTDRRYVEGHLHLLSAVRLSCSERLGDRIAAIYTAALSVGTVAWIGTGETYEKAWNDMFPYGAAPTAPVQRAVERPRPF